MRGGQAYGDLVCEVATLHCMSHELPSLMSALLGSKQSPVTLQRLEAPQSSISQNRCSELQVSLAHHACPAWLHILWLFEQHRKIVADGGELIRGKFIHVFFLLNTSK